MKINWLFGGTRKIEHDNLRVNTEYGLELKVRLVLIREAEHLLEHLDLIVLNLEPTTGNVQIDPSTPEPLFSVLSQNLHLLTMSAAKVKTR